MAPTRELLEGAAWIFNTEHLLLPRYDLQPAAAAASQPAEKERNDPQSEPAARREGVGTLRAPPHTFTFCNPETQPGPVIAAVDGGVRDAVPPGC